MTQSKFQSRLLGGILACGLLLGGAVGAMKIGIAPTAKGEPVIVKVEQGTSFNGVLKELEGKGILRSSFATYAYAKISGQARSVKAGSYRLRPGMTNDEIFLALRNPTASGVRIPEGWWIRRVGERLEEQGICNAADYENLAKQPAHFQKLVHFKLPEDSLEGYLYPDTYNFPVACGADAVISKQLRTFERKVAAKFSNPDDLDRAVVIGSMLQLEVSRPNEATEVAGIIENRLRKNMRLQIDATVLYAMNEWRVLQPGEVAEVESPYNTYKINGLPPGPIGSPNADMIFAASNPAKTKNLYYVAKPDDSHLFASTYSAHLQNIRRARAMARRSSPG